MADPWSVTDGWWGTDGEWHATEPEVRAELHLAMGAGEHPDGPPEGPPRWFVTAGDTPEVWSEGEVELEDGTTVPVLDRLPADLPIGTHELVSAGGHRTALYVVPQEVRSLRRGWGWAVQLHAARSRASWGIGDLADLAHLAQWARDQGAVTVAHSPLGAHTPSIPVQPSPYYASSRRFCSPLYLRIEAVEGAELAAAEVARAAVAASSLRQGAWIDRDEAWRLKLAALERIWPAVRDSSLVRSSLEDADSDAALGTHASFCVLAEMHGGGRSRFPTEHAHPASPDVAAAVAARSDRYDFWRWVSLEVESQTRLASSAGAELMADLPVGFDPDGSDAWADQDLLALGCRIGAPPDEFNRAGQDWGLPPYVPWRLRAAGYEPWIDVLRRSLRRAGALRIDHVMGLFRLYVVPPGQDPTRGAYVAQHGTEMLELACLEAARAGAALVGEDLGTVEPEVREHLAHRGVYGYRVAWFEDTPPELWPPRTVAMMTTHDLPTVAGLWSGRDASDRARAGKAPDPAGDELLRRRLERLAGTADLGPGATGPADGAAPEALPCEDVTTRAYEALGRAGSDLVLATLEDALGVESRPNLPGTVDEHPNWRVALPVLIEDLDEAGTARIAAVLDRERPAGT